MANKLEQPLNKSTREAETFLQAALKLAAETGRDQKQVFQFFKANLNKLNDSALLPALPLVFKILTNASATKPQCSSAHANGRATEYAPMPLLTQQEMDDQGNEETSQ